METSQSSLQEQVDFLHQKNEALFIENSCLKEQNTQLLEELEIVKTINQNLKEKLAENDFSDSPQKPYRKSSSLTVKFPLGVHKNSIDENESPSKSWKDDQTDQSKLSLSQREEDESTNISNVLGNPEIRRELFIKQYESDLSISEATTIDDKKQTDVKERYAEKMELNNLSDVETLINGILENPDWFFKLNNITRLPPRSPFARQKYLQIEKNLDEVENLLRKWSKLLKQVDASCQSYSKSMEALGTQLLADKGFFEYNKELQNLIVIIAQFVKENSSYLDIFSRVMNSTVINPIRSFYKSVIPTYKDSRKKVQKALEELEVAESKYLSIKKSTVVKDPFSSQTSLKNYMNAYRNLELSRLDYIRALNDINVNFNIECIDKFCGLFRTKKAYIESSSDLVLGLEGQIQAYNNSITKKSELYGNLCDEFKKLKSDIEKNIYITYPVTFSQNVIKEGYLFVKTEKELKKRYCILQENGMLCWAKDPENLTEEPQLKDLIDIKLCKVRESTDSDLMFCFELVSVLVKKPLLLQADSEAAATEWINAIQKHIETVLFTSHTSELNSPVLRKTVSEQPSSKDNLKSTETSKFKPSAQNSPTQKNKQSLVAFILENNVCTDCGAKDPSWVSLNLASVICIECSGVHRRLGASISKVRSLKLDNLSVPILELFSKLNSQEVNRVWEGAIDQAPSMKPDTDSDQDRREAFIRNKYVEKVFLKPVPEEDHIKAMCQALKDKNIYRVLNILAHAKANFNELHNIDGKKQGILHYACAYSSKEIVELLIQNKCSLTLLDQDHCKPLDYSMFGHNVEVMEYLVKKLDELEK